MTTKELRNQIINNYLKEWVVGIGTWKIRKDGSVDVLGTVNLPSYLSKKIPFKFNKIQGNFCCYSTELETFENFPEVINGYLYSYGKLFNSLDHFPKRVNGHINMTRTFNLLFKKEEILKVCKVKEDRIYIYDN